MRRTTKLEKTTEQQGYYTIVELARFCGVPKETMRTWRRRSQLPHPVSNTAKGWDLWSADQARKLLQELTKKGK